MQTLERRKIKGNNFSQQIENGQEFKKFTQLAYENQHPNDIEYPLNFIKEIALTPLQIVEQDRENYIKNYMHKGTLTRFAFLNNVYFLKALEYVDRPKIRKVK